jgi:hypothetical protein
MNLLTNGFVNNYGRLFGPSEQFEATSFELRLSMSAVGTELYLRARVRFGNLSAEAGL